MNVNGLGTTMPNVLPLNDKNAIQSAAFAIEFSEQVTPEVVQKFIALHKQDPEMRKKYPRVQPIEMMSFQVGMPNATSSAPVKALAGVTFDLLRPDGTQQVALSLRPDALIFNCAQYENWNVISDQAISALDSVSHLCDGMKVSAIALEYLDVFKVADISNAGWLKELFNEKTNYLPSHLINAVGYWHNHQGFFSKSRDSKYDLLNNITIDCVPGAEGNVVQIRSQHKVSEVFNSGLKPLFANGDVSNIFEFEHDVTRRVLEELLSDNMLKAIRMKS